jgi:hypothetical protein
MRWITRSHQISSFGETDESIISAGASVQSTAGSQDVRISGNNAGYTMFRDSVRSTGYLLHSTGSSSSSRSSGCAITFQLQSNITALMTSHSVPLAEIGTDCRILRWEWRLLYLRQD